jgi:uncharacterized protein (DUF2267 family)
MTPFDKQARLPNRDERHRSRANATYRSFVNEVASRGAFTRDEAVRFTVAVIATLEERLTLPAVSDLEAQLPTVLQELLDEEPILDRPRMDKGEFCGRVALRLDASEDEAESISRVVFAVLRARISPGEARHVEEQLPEELKALWRPSSSAS